MMGNQMKDGNPYIADLSDKNRPTKVADTYSELYDNEWTDAFDVLQTTAYRKEEKDIARQLLDILMVRKDIGILPAVAVGYMSLVLRKPVFWVCDQVRHNPGCTVTKDG